MTKMSWTAVSSAVVFALLAVLLGVLGIPYVARSPGVTVNLLGTNAAGKQNVSVAGVKTYPSTGELLLTTVSVTRPDSRLSLPEALVAAALPNHDLLPRATVYSPTLTTDEVKTQSVDEMQTSQQAALVAALRAAGQPVKQMPMVTSVVTGGPSDGKLQPGDLIQKVDATAVQSVQDVARMVAKHQVGDTITMTVLRGQKSIGVSITAVASNDGKSQPRIGISIDTGYDVSASATYGLDPSIVGPSGGLMFSLTIFDRITSADLVAGRIVAGTGEIDASGTIGTIGGIREKIAGAQKAGATVFLVPAGNCQDIQGLTSRMKLVKVTAIDDAISSLTALKSPVAAKEVPHC